MTAKLSLALHSKKTEKQRLFNSESKDQTRTLTEQVKKYVKPTESDMPGTSSTRTLLQRVTFHIGSLGAKVRAWRKT
jgi:hypothetical protein